MDSTTRYLTAPLVDGLVYEISDELISIRCPHTCFISIGNISVPLEKAALLEQYKRLLQLAREKGVKVSYTSHIRKTVCGRWTEYMADFQAARRLFTRMVEQARVIERRGIHRGWSDDRELEQLYALQRQFEQYLYGDSAISRVAGAKSHLDDIERHLTQSPELGMISL